MYIVYEYIPVYIYIYNYTGLVVSWYYVLVPSSQLVLCIGT